MRWYFRLVMLAFGLSIILYGVDKLERGHFAYMNGRGQIIFAPAVISTGVVLALLAFLPSGGDRLYRKITTRRPPVDTTFHSHRQRSGSHQPPKDGPSNNRPSE